jgi:hypothetical protein
VAEVREEVGGAEVREEEADLVGGGDRVTADLASGRGARAAAATWALFLLQRGGGDTARVHTSSSSTAARARFLHLGALPQSLNLRPPSPRRLPELPSHRWPRIAWLGRWSSPPPVFLLLEGTLPSAFAFSIGEVASREQCLWRCKTASAISCWSQSQIVLLSSDSQES